MLNPTALRKAKIVCNFGLSECNRVKLKLVDNHMQLNNFIAHLQYLNQSSKSKEPGLVDMVLALHAGSRKFDSHQGICRFFQSNRPGYPHPVSSELENSGIRVAVGKASALSNR